MKMRLTEAQLLEFVEQAVVEAMVKQGYPINEDMDENFKSKLTAMGKKLVGDAGKAAKKLGSNISSFAKDTNNNVRNSASRLGSRINQGMENFDNAVNDAIDKYGMKAHNGVESVGNAVKTAGQKVGQYAKDVHQAGVDASNIADIQNAIKTLTDLKQKGFLNASASNIVIGSLNKAIQQIQGGAQ